MRKWEEVKVGDEIAVYRSWEMKWRTADVVAIGPKYLHFHLDGRRYKVSKETWRPVGDGEGFTIEACMEAVHESRLRQELIVRLKMWIYSSGTRDIEVLKEIATRLGLYTEGEDARRPGP